MTTSLALVEGLTLAIVVIVALAGACIWAELRHDVARWWRVRKGLCPTCAVPTARLVEVACKGDGWLMLKAERQACRVCGWRGR